MTVAFVAIIVGLALLVLSADLFVEGSASVARHFGMPPLLIGMVIVGFGTSAPEMVVSALAATNGNPGIALGNAYGSNITNIALVLGVTALIMPITVHSQVLRKELPILAIITLITANFQENIRWLKNTSIGLPESLGKPPPVARAISMGLYQRDLV